MSSKSPRRSHRQDMAYEVTQIWRDDRVDTTPLQNYSTSIKSSADYERPYDQVINIFTFILKDIEV